MVNKKLWLRHLSCGHTRATYLQYLYGRHTKKPKVGESCYCRECHQNVKITKVEEVEPATDEELKEWEKKAEKLK